jgi:hypothetical protein
MRSIPTLFDQDTIESKFWEFHLNNPRVYDQLVSLARQWIAAGNNKLGIKTLFERLRWEWHIAGLMDADGYKLNNNYTAHYARLIMAREPDLDGLFETRRLTAERN